MGSSLKRPRPGQFFGKNGQCRQCSQCGQCSIPLGCGISCATVLVWPALLAANSVALKASGKGGWTATARPEKAFKIIDGPRRPSLTNREENRPALPQLCWRRSLSLAELGRSAGVMGYGALGFMQKQVPKARRNSNIILWHPSGVRAPEGTLPGGRSPFTLNDHRLPSTNPPGWRKSEFIVARALSPGADPLRPANGTSSGIASENGQN